MSLPEDPDQRDTDPLPELPAPREHGSVEVLPPLPPLPEVIVAELRDLHRDAARPVPPRRVLPLEPEPSPLVARYLFPTERFRGEWKKHWVSLFTTLAIGVGATFVMGYLSGVFARNDANGLMAVIVVGWIVVLGAIGWKLVDWYYDRFILTNKRVMVISGVITRRVAMMPLLRVTDMKYEQSPMGRLFNYGTFVLESAGQQQALRKVTYLPNPNQLYLRVVEEMYEPEAVETRLGRGDDGPGEGDRGDGS